MLTAVFSSGPLILVGLESIARKLLFRLHDVHTAIVLK